MRFRASFPVDAASAAQAYTIAENALRPRAAPTLDGAPANIRIVAEPTVRPDERVMRWAWSVVVGGVQLTIAYEHTDTTGARRRRGVVAIMRENRDPQIEAAYIPAEKMAELVRALGQFPLDLMDEAAMQDMRRRQETSAGGVDAFGELPTLGGDK